MTCCGRNNGECVCAKEATCSCGKQPALQCTCEKATTENKLPTSTCACGKRAEGESRSRAIYGSECGLIMDDRFVHVWTQREQWIVGA
ncbi:hypothetical protein DE146DRAFT_653939 [Phaeosphaeria sp. MPI-PUGE-AT-0046c]|nr:hypothetical protein DE146DRAFT_653939 [Phaeosphaeria sp. MPI-PUGE-AT-0046c]